MSTKVRLVLHIGLSAFIIYFCMYAFRKPFTAATFEGLQLLGISFKVVLVIAQVIGYTLSKFIGIKFISGTGFKNRATYIIGFILFAELALLGFAIVPQQYKSIFLVLNGMPLGMIWGLVFSYLEGRTITEVLAAILSASYIIASGMTKSVGKLLMTNYNISEFWMPFYTGALFIIPLFIAVWSIEKIPPPTKEDIKNRNKRVVMTDNDRKKMFSQLAPGLIALIILLFLMTGFRDLRDNFVAELWKKLGHGNSAALFTQTEVWITIFILFILGLFIFIKDNLKALSTMQILMFLGLLLQLIITFLYQVTQNISPFWWMTLSGLGLFMTYVPLGSMVFERISSLFKFKSNAGFLIYVADAISYSGTVLILLVKELFYPKTSIYEYFTQMIYICSILGIGCLLFSFFYFKKRFYALK
ncbi:DUF5690 family protein [Aquimarina longa]|uniref:DUF5690 family protein n=1 Tax=Aquimarina longa TaxID=1080221 RepID=UPI0007808161|nr:DUF5690 family protein [Aquimarina longa]